MDIREYLEAPFQDRATNVFTGDQPWDSAVNNTLGHPFGYVAGLTPAEQMKIWNNVLDEYDMEQAVLFPTGSGTIPGLQEPDFAIAVARACNNQFAADYTSDRLKPVGVLPMRNPAAAAEELAHIKELGLVGVEVLPIGLDRALGDPIYDPVYEAAERLGISIGIHGTRHWAREFSGDKLRTFAEVHCYAFVAGMLPQFTSVMASGVTVRFPKLRMAFLEIGATWLPYYLDRLDEHWEKRPAEMPHLAEKPSDIFRKSSLVVSLEAEESTLAHTIDFVGAEHLVFATDIPHWDTEFPDNLNRLREAPDISDSDKKLILYDNAKALFDL